MVAAWMSECPRLKRPNPSTLMFYCAPRLHVCVCVFVSGVCGVHVVLVACVHVCLCMGHEHVWVGVGGG